MGSESGVFGGTHLVLAQIEVSRQSCMPAVFEIEGSVLNACWECIVDSKLSRGQQTIPVILLWVNGVLEHVLKHSPSSQSTIRLRVVCRGLAGHVAPQSHEVQ